MGDRIYARSHLIVYSVREKCLVYSRPYVSAVLNSHTRQSVSANAIAGLGGTERNILAGTAYIHSNRLNEM